MLHDPFLMKGMGVAVDRIVQAIANKEKVLIEFVNKFNLTFKFNEIQELDEKVDASREFKISLIKKYINVELSHLQNEEIKLINEILGEDFFNKIGYEMKAQV
jgi:hypothetical protein